MVTDEKIKLINWKQHGSSYYGKINNTIVASIQKVFGNKYEVKVQGINGSTTDKFPVVSDERVLMNFAQKKFETMLMEFLDE